MKHTSRKILGIITIILMTTLFFSCESLEPKVEEEPAETASVMLDTIKEPIAEETVEEPVSEPVESIEPAQKITDPVEAPEPVVEEISEPVTEDLPAAEPEAAEEPSAPEPVVEGTPAETEAVIDTPEADDQSSHLYILHTNDTHGRILEGDYDGMGFAKIATIVDMYENQVDNLLVLDAGDALHGTTLATLFEGESVVDVMDAVGYDAMAAGNHDFNYGYERLIELDGLSDFPILSANTYDADGNRYFAPYTLFEFSGFTVGVFGLTTSESYYKVHPKHIEGLTFADSVETAKLMVAELEGQADIIIALTHLGIDKASTDTSTRLAEQVEGIDLIIDGHSHTTLPVGLKVGETLIVQAGSFDKNLGAVDITYEDGRIIDMSAQLYSKEQVDLEGIAPASDVLSVVEEYLSREEQMTSEIIAYTDSILDGEREDVRTRPTNLSKLITASMIEATGADCAITNGGGIRSSIDLGEITLREIISVLPFNNTCVVIELTGQELYDAVEHGLSMAPEENGAYCQLGNLVSFYNVYEEPGNRVYKLKVDGETIDKSMTYTVATNDFLAAGGDGYEMFADKPLLAEVDTLDGVFADYMSKHFPLPE